ncbi:MAG: AsnC family protein [Candidatus Micrarchaeota archaeon]|nr:AsnC family protein [Candidatus Micrarchaeota archaeon]
MEDSEVENRIITLLSMDCRISVDRMAPSVGVTRDQVYGRTKKLIEKYDVRFVPQINISNLQKYEFLGISWGKSKREILNKISEDNIEIGFEEYIALIDFKGGEPSDKEILDALGDSYIPQYVARISGQHNLFIYAIARHSSDITEFMYKFMNKLDRFNSIERLQFIYPSFGFFPINNKFIEQIQIQPRYKKLLLLLNSNAKTEFSRLTKGMGGISPATVGVLYVRLKEIGLLERPTLYLVKPEELIIKLFIFSIVDRQKFSKNRDKFLLDFVQDKIKNYIFMATIRNPGGGIIFARFKTPLEVEEFKKSFINIDLGIELSESTVLQNIYGNLGVRNFLPEETTQYKELESKGLVGKVNKSKLKK